MPPKIPQRLSQLVRKRAKHRYEYCQSSEAVSGQIFHVDHVIPRAQSGQTTEENTCLACPACNGTKLDRTTGIDPATGIEVALYNPRTQRWSEHFRWSSDATQIEGLTSCGRATIAVLKLNRPLIVNARSLWVSFRKHPPVDEESYIEHN